MIPSEYKIIEPVTFDGFFSFEKCCYAFLFCKEISDTLDRTKTKNLFYYNGQRNCTLYHNLFQASYD